MTGINLKNFRFKKGDAVDYKRAVRPQLIVGHGTVIQVCSSGYIIDDVKYGQSEIILFEYVRALGRFGPAPQSLTAT